MRARKAERGTVSRPGAELPSTGPEVLGRAQNLDPAGAVLGHCQGIDLAAVERADGEKSSARIPTPVIAGTRLTRGLPARRRLEPPRGPIRRQARTSTTSISLRFALIHSHSAINHGYAGPREEQR